MSSIFDAFASVAGQEELGLENQPAEVIAPEEVAEVVADKVIAENQEQLNEIAESVEKLAEAVEDSQETIEEIQDTVEGLESLLNGNFNPVAASKSYARLQKLVAKIGGDIGSERHGTEALTDADTAQMLMRDGMEAATKEGEGWFSRAGTFLKALFQKIAAFVVGLFNSAAGYKRKVEILRSAIRSGSVKNKIKVGDWNRYIDAKNFKASSAKAVVDYAQIGSCMNKLSDVISQADKYASNLGEFTKVYGGLTASLKKTQFGSGNSVSKGGTDRAIINVLGMRVVVQFMSPAAIKEVKDIAKACRAVRTSMVANPDSKIETSGEVDVSVTAAELESVLGDCLEGVKIMETLKANKGFNTAGADKLIAHLRAEMTKDDDKAKAKEVFNNITAIAAMSNRLLNDQSTMVSKAIKASLSFVSACVGKKEAAK